MSTARIHFAPVARRRRQTEIRDALNSFGMPVRARRASARVPGAASEVAAALRALGPVFRTFGSYLASRVDLLHPADVPAFGDLRPAVPPLSRTVVERVVTQQTGAFLEELFREFDDAPVESCLVWQVHHAVLQDGTPVTVKVLRPESEERWRPDLEFLALLEGAAANVGIGRDGLDGALEDFALRLQQQSDLAAEARWLDALASDADSFDLLYGPEVCRRASTARLLTVSRPTGVGLTGRNAPPRDESARAVGIAWLRQALLGTAFPAEIAVGNVTLADDGRVCFAAATYDRIPIRMQPVLLDYVMAECNHDVDRACSLLVTALREAGACEPGERLPLCFRQAVPYRHGVTSGIAGRLRMHWRIASEDGCLPRGHMLSFYRGLGAVAAIADEASPDRDLLAAAIQDVHVMAGVARFRNMFDPAQMSVGVARYAALMVDGPRLLDEGLSTIHSGGGRIKLHVAENVGQTKKSDSTAVVLALMLALPAVGMVLHQFALRSAPVRWMDRIDAALVVLFGAWILRSIRRMI
jgi:hypothetical protein